MPAEQYTLPWKHAQGGAERGPYVGTSGWSYRSWQKTVLRDVSLKKRLSHLSRMFNAVEVNGSFYGQVKRKTYQAWREATEPSFRFSVKGHRFVTHYKRLLDCGDPVQRLREQVQGLGDKLAVVLWQLPAHFQANLGRLDDFLAVLDRNWPDARHAIELRHASWFTEEARERLARARVASCLSDAPDFPLWDAVTTDLVYVRLHGHSRKYASSYSRSSLQHWADRVVAWAKRGLEVHVYFDNDAEGAAVKNALTLRNLLGLPGLSPGRP
jgi:uncharacterized protein YecE (DUF72 family)